MDHKFMAMYFLTVFHIAYSASDQCIIINAVKVAWYTTLFYTSFKVVYLA